LELFDQDTSVEVVAGKDTFEEVTKYKMKSQSLCFLVSLISLLSTNPIADPNPQSLNFPRGDSLLGPTLLRRSSSRTDSLLGVASLNPLLNPFDSLSGIKYNQVYVNEEPSGRNVLGSSRTSTNIMTLLKSSPMFSVLVRALTLTDLAESLKVTKPGTPTV